MSGRIVVIDNDRKLCNIIEMILSDNGYAVTCFNNPLEGVAAVAGDPPDLVISDVKMPEMDGIEVLDHVKRRSPETPVVMITAHATVDVSVQAIRKGAEDLLIKPFEAGELLLRVSSALRRSELSRENRELRRELNNRFRAEDIIGMSRGIKELLERVKKVAPRDLPVLITGESGTGKELVARAVHRNSLRKDGPFIAVNCGALPQNIMESELFGYRKGAFTGATEDRPGVLEMANGGTLFLDEVGNLSMDAQKGLLRFLQEKETKRLGDTKTMTVDVRVISAVNADLLSLAGKGEFREDLYYRLNGITLLLPPLRERKEDIPLLAAHFVAAQNRRFGTNCAGFDADAMTMLTTYAWPGNVRELKNVVEAATAMITGTHITKADIGQFLRTSGTERHDSVPRAMTDADYETASAAFERDYLRGLLQVCGGNVEEAARRAGLNIATLYRKLKKYSPA